MTRRVVQKNRPTMTKKMKVGIVIFVKLAPH